jgi:gluconolactonase
MVHKTFNFCGHLLIFIILSCPTARLQQPVLNNPELIFIASGFQFVEGPVWKDGIGILFSDIPANIVYRWTEASGTSVYLNPSGNSNGLALDHEGNLILAQHGPRQVARLETNNSITPLATHFDQKRLNSPNDLAIHSNGSIFFTDPPYGLNDQQGTPELSFNGIFRLSPQGLVYLLDSTLSRPNGIAFSPDETKIYVSDSETRRIYRWDVIGDTTISNKEEFAYMQPAGYADGMKVDTAGYLYVAGPLGIWIFNSFGDAVDTIPVPGQTTNCGWGDPDRMSLYVTSGNAIYKIRNKTDSPISLRESQFKSGFIFGTICPNPFSESIRIPFYLGEACLIKLDIYNLIGKKITTLLNNHLSAGNHSIVWDVNDDTKGLLLVQATLNNSVNYSLLIEKI